MFIVKTNSKGEIHSLSLGGLPEGFSRTVVSCFVCKSILEYTATSSDEDREWAKEHIPHIMKATENWETSPIRMEPL